MMHSWWIRVGVVCIAIAGLFVSLGAGGKTRNKPKQAVAMMRLPETVMKPPPRSVMEVAPVDRGTRGAIREAASRIDGLLAGHWQEHGVSPSRPLADEAFVRRVYLELGGRIPTHDEVVAFLGSAAADRRGDLIARLLESPDYVSHSYNYWADILRLQERPDKHLVFEPYLHYVKEAIRTNTPYDTWAHEMLTANGRPWENPAVGFQLRDEGMPLPYVDNTVRVFLGTQIGCAQCHDHPFDHWTQREFYELAALTAGTRTRPGGDASGWNWAWGNPFSGQQSDVEFDLGDLGDVVEQFFGAGFGGARRSSKKDIKKGKDLYSKEFDSLEDKEIKEFVGSVN
jgi:hypothetical protein